MSHCPHKHARFKLQGRVFNNHTHLGGTRSGIKHRINKGDDSSEGFSGIGFRCKIHFSAITQHIQIAFVGIQ